jgi:hypothetical protein
MVKDEGFRDYILRPKTPSCIVDLSRNVFWVLQASTAETLMGYRTWFLAYAATLFIPAPFWVCSLWRTDIWIASAEIRIVVLRSFVLWLGGHTDCTLPTVCSCMLSTYTKICKKFSSMCLCVCFVFMCVSRNVKLLEFTGLLLENGFTTYSRRQMSFSKLPGLVPKKVKSYTTCSSIVTQIYRLMWNANLKMKV